MKSIGACLATQGDQQMGTPDIDESSLNTDPEKHWTPQGRIFMSPLTQGKLGSVDLKVT